MYYPVNVHKHAVDELVGEFAKRMAGNHLQRLGGALNAFSRGFQEVKVSYQAAGQEIQSGQDRLVSCKLA